LRTDLALEQFEAALAQLAEVGDRSGRARLTGRLAGALSGSRRREEGATLARAALSEFEDLGDDNPDLLLLLKAVAASYLATREYAKSSEVADRLLAAAERNGLQQLAAEALSIKGSAALSAGRLWEARALLLGARQLAEEAGLTDVVLNVMVALPSFVALDSPTESVRIQREAIELARRMGDRASEGAILFNATEDARRSGDWDWAVHETEALDQLDIDEAGHLANQTQALFFHAYRGAEVHERMADLQARLLATEDVDMHAGVYDLEGSMAHAEGRWSGAVDAWFRVCEHSDLNAPYALPKAARVAILARDPQRAREALDRLAALGTRGRAVDADRTATLAGLAGLEGRFDAARAGYRSALAQYRDLELPWDEATATLEAASVLGAADPEVAGWVASARDVFTRLGAVTMIARLDEVTAGATATPRHDAVPSETSREESTAS
jgi:tetratricopeptide (TPR) repeat protein